MAAAVAAAAVAVVEATVEAAINIRASSGDGGRGKNYRQEICYGNGVVKLFGAG